MSAAPPFDLVVIGAGPAGAATAFHAAHSGLRVALLDQARFPRDKICGDGLTARAVVELRALDAETAAAGMGARINRFELGAPLGHTRSALYGADGYPDYAYVVPRLKLDALLVERAVAAGATLLEDHAVERWQQVGSVLQLSARHAGRGITLTGRCAVLACGAHLRPLLRNRILTRKPQVMMAVRQYLEGVADDDTWRLHYSRRTVPGYGWIFPAGAGLANVGIGLYRRRSGERLADTLAHYLAQGGAREHLRGARACGPAVSFPLRCDFLEAPLSAPRLLIAGEAAGLVNPLTGEGIDYALESGRIAAAHAARMLTERDESAVRADYERALHHRYAALFAFCLQLRRWCSSPWRVSALTVAAQLRPDLRRRLVRLLLGGGEMSAPPSARRILRAVLGLAPGSR